MSSEGVFLARVREALRLHYIIVWRGHACPRAAGTQTIEVVSEVGTTEVNGHDMDHCRRHPPLAWC